MDENIGSIVTAEESVSLGVVEPLDGAFQTFHARPLFLHVLYGGPKDVRRSANRMHFGARRVGCKANVCQESRGAAAAVPRSATNVACSGASIFSPLRLA